MATCLRPGRHHDEPRQARGDRRNALKSTGPRTTAGKAIASQNAVRHGLVSRGVLLPDEDAQAFRAVRARLWAELRPMGALKAPLVERIVSSAWRLGRLLVAEAELVEEGRDDGEGRDLGIGPAFDGDWGDALSRFSRYEAAVEPGFYRALRELERVQAARAGGRSLPPAAGDVAVSEATAEKRCYKLLGQVERAFRALKTIDLKVRPIFHRREARVRAHIFLCLLASLSLQDKSQGRRGSGWGFGVGGMGRSVRPKGPGGLS